MQDAFSLACRRVMTMVVARPVFMAVLMLVRRAEKAGKMNVRGCPMIVRHLGSQRVPVRYRCPLGNEESR